MHRTVSPVRFWVSSCPTSGDQNAGIYDPRAADSRRPRDRGQIADAEARRSFSNSRTRFCRSVGLTPGIREACASVVGRIAAELLPRLERERSHLAVRRIGLERELAHSSQLRRLVALAREIAGVLELEIGRHDGIAE